MGPLSSLVLLCLAGPPGARALGTMTLETWLSVQVWDLRHWPSLGDLTAQTKPLPGQMMIHWPQEEHSSECQVGSVPNPLSILYVPFYHACVGVDAVGPYRDSKTWDWRVRAKYTLLSLAIKWSLWPVAQGSWHCFLKQCVYMCICVCV